jgi:hypothetical protein
MLANYQEIKHLRQAAVFSGTQVWRLPFWPARTPVLCLTLRTVENDASWRVKFKCRAPLDLLLGSHESSNLRLGSKLPMGPRSALAAASLLNGRREGAHNHIVEAGLREK